MTAFCYLLIRCNPRPPSAAAKNLEIVARVVAQTPGFVYRAGWRRQKGMSRSSEAS
jgi:hypothetical protein